MQSCTSSCHVAFLSTRRTVYLCLITIFSLPIPQQTIIICRFAIFKEQAKLLSLNLNSKSDLNTPNIDMFIDEQKKTAVDLFICVYAIAIGWIEDNPGNRIYIQWVANLECCNTHVMIPFTIL